ncbi:hypothetical protein BDW22DRAFT_1020878 [Trametopsis cervina]|nr:hypothetical protein BDW22DRAFT_1020878 [Trametopsis cervina]
MRGRLNTFRTRPPVSSEHLSFKLISLAFHVGFLVLSTTDCRRCWMARPVGPGHQIHVILAIGYPHYPADFVAVMRDP